LPNAEYQQNFKEGKMELYSTQSIRTGQEVTICYDSNFRYMIASERKAYLRRLYGFTCNALLVQMAQLLERATKDVDYSKKITIVA
jgi:hypothetical protein